MNWRCAIDEALSSIRLQRQQARPTTWRYVDPPSPWKQMYHEVWRIERDFFYPPNSTE